MRPNSRSGHAAYLTAIFSHVFLNHNDNSLNFDFMHHFHFIWKCRFLGFVHLSYQKCSVDLKYAKMRWPPGLRPRPRWESSRRSPRPLSRLGRGNTTSPFPTPFLAPSALDTRRLPSFRSVLPQCKILDRRLAVYILYMYRFPYCKLKFYDTGYKRFFL